MYKVPTSTGNKPPRPIDNFYDAIRAASEFACTVRSHYDVDNSKRDGVSVEIIDELASRTWVVK